jgi:hypothetical protein
VLQQIFYLISYCYTFLKMPLKIISSLSNRGESKPPPISSLIYFFRPLVLDHNRISLDSKLNLNILDLSLNFNLEPSMLCLNLLLNLYFKTWT